MWKKNNNLSCLLEIIERSVGRCRAKHKFIKDLFDNIAGITIIILKERKGLSQMYNMDNTIRDAFKNVNPDDIRIIGFTDKQTAQERADLLKMFLYGEKLLGNKVSFDDPLVEEEYQRLDISPKDK